MGYQIYCGKGFDTQKAERFFKERRVPYQRVDVLKYGIGKRELESVAAAVGLDALCDIFENLVEDFEDLVEEDLETPVEPTE